MLTAELDRLRAELMWHKTISESVVNNWGRLDREMGESGDLLRRVGGLSAERATAPPPQSPSKTGMNALLGEVARRSPKGEGVAGGG